MWLRLRRRLYVILEAGKTGDTASNIFDTAMVGLILANVIAFAAETVPGIGEAWIARLELFNLISIVIFTVEYVARLWVCVEHPPLRHLPKGRVRLRWAVTPLMIVDLLVILPYYIAFFVPVDLRVLRVFRLLRFLKLVRFSPALATLGRVLRQEQRALFGALIIMLGMLICSAAALYALEHDVQPEAFGSLPAAMWWAMATLTTVGYGDVVPVTAAGRLVGGMVMLLGLGMFALPIAIIATGFSQEIHRREFVVNWGMVARVPLFSGLAAPALGTLTQLLQARSFGKGALIVQEGEPAEGMFFIASGRVEVHLPSETVVLEEGEFFGEVALVQRGPRLATAIAATDCNLLELERHDFERFMMRHPEVRARIMDVVRARLAAGEAKAMEEEIAEAKRTKEEAAGDGAARKVAEEIEAGAPGKKKDDG